MNSIDEKFIKKSSGLFNFKAKLSFIVIVLLLISQIFITNLLLGNEDMATLYKNSTGGFVSVYGVIPLYTYEFYSTLNSSDLEVLEVDSDLRSEPFKVEGVGSEIFKGGMNVIAIQIESLDAKLIGYEYNGQEVTPLSK